MRRAPGAEPSSGAATRLPGYFPGLQNRRAWAGSLRAKGGPGGGAWAGLDAPRPPAAAFHHRLVILVEAASSSRSSRRLGAESRRGSQKPRERTRSGAGPAMPPAAAAPAGDRAPAASGAQLDPGEARL